MSDLEIDTSADQINLHRQFADPNANSAAEVCHQFRKALTAFRMYEPEHGSRKEAVTALFQKISAANDLVGELVFQISANLIRWGDNTVYSEEGSQTDSLTRNLFMDGVQRIRFLPGLQEAEVQRFLVLWHIAMHGRFPPGHSFSTQVWEEEFSFISLDVVESFADVLEAAGAEGRSKREENIESLSSLLIQRESPRAPPEGMIRASNLPVAGDVNVISMLLENLAGIRSETIQPNQIQQMRSIHPLSNEEMTHMVTHIRSSLQDSAGQRSLAILWAMLPLVSSEEDQGSLEKLVQRVFRMLVGEGAYDELDEAVKNIIGMVRAVPARFPELETFLSHLLTDDGLGHFVRMLDDENRQQFGLSLLRYIPGSQMARLVAQLPLTPSKTARGHLMSLIQKKGVTVSILLEQLKQIGPQTTNLDFLDELYFLANQQSEEDSEEFTNAGLAHLDRRVRTYTFNNLTEDSLSKHSERFHRLLADPNSEIWRLVLNNLMRLQDQGAVPYLIPLLGKNEVTPDHKKLIIRALGAIGGTKSEEALETIFNGKDALDMRCAAALSLGSMGTVSKWKDIFEKESKKLLGNKEFKNACGEALRRIEMRENKSSR